MSLQLTILSNSRNGDTNIHNANNLFMTSFDVESLFTNIPLHKTIDICLNSLFTCPASVVLGLVKVFFRILLKLSVPNSFLIFNRNFYKQIEGLGMGLPLGPMFANIFMCHDEQIWLYSCPLSFCPIFYQRYVYDIFFIIQT